MSHTSIGGWPSRCASVRTCEAPLVASEPSVAAACCAYRRSVSTSICSLASTSVLIASVRSLRSSAIHEGPEGCPFAFVSGVEAGRSSDAEAAQPAGAYGVGWTPRAAVRRSSGSASRTASRSVCSTRCAGRSDAICTSGGSRSRAKKRKSHEVAACRARVCEARRANQLWAQRRGGSDGGRGVCKGRVEGVVEGVVEGAGEGAVEGAVDLEVEERGAVDLEVEEMGAGGGASSCRPAGGAAVARGRAIRSNQKQSEALSHDLQMGLPLREELELPQQVADLLVVGLAHERLQLGHVLRKVHDREARAVGLRRERLRHDHDDGASEGRARPIRRRRKAIEGGKKVRELEEGNRRRHSEGAPRHPLAA